MISQADVNVAQKHFKVTNHGWYVAYFEVQYTFQNQTYNADSGTFSLGMERKIFVPETATDIIINISVAVGVNWTIIESKFLSAMETTCFTLYGTLFTPYALEVNCTATPDLGSGNGDSTNPPCCCCCNCCGMCQQSSMSMEEYTQYLNNFYQNQNK